MTGRRLDELLSVFPHVHLFGRVAENGALLYRPPARERLDTAVTERLEESLRRRPQRHLVAEATQEHHTLPA